MESNLHRLTNETVYIAETYQTRPFNIIHLLSRLWYFKLKQKVLLSPHQTRVEQVARVLLPSIGRTQSGTSTTSALQEGLCFVACSLLFAYSDNLSLNGNQVVPTEMLAGSYMSV